MTKTDQPLNVPMTIKTHEGELEGRWSAEKYRSLVHLITRTRRQLIDTGFVQVSVTVCPQTMAASLLSGLVDDVFGDGGSSLIFGGVFEASLDVGLADEDAGIFTIHFVEDMK